MSKIEIGRYSDRLRRALGMKGASIVSGELSPEISPVFVLEGPAVEWEFLQGVRICGVTTVVAAVVGNRSIARLRNPLGSGIIATVTLVEQSTQGVAEVELQLGRAQVNLAITGATAVRDSRWSPTSVLFRTAMQASSTAAGAVPEGEDVLWRTLLPDNVEGRYRQGIMMQPGDSLDLSSTTLNVTMHATYAWKERPVAPLEL